MTLNFLFPSQHVHSPLLEPLEIQPTDLQTRVELVVSIFLDPFLPSWTRLLHDLVYLLLVYTLWLLHDINIQSRASMNHQMTMKRPHARVIRVELYDEIRWKIWCSPTHLRTISTLRVFRPSYGAIPLPASFS